MKARTIAATIVVGALLVGGGTAVAQDSSPNVVLTYSDVTVDRPIAIAIAEINELHGEGITHALSVEQITANADAYAGACVVAVGRDGTATAAHLRDEYDLRAMEAQGADRDETAWLTAKRVVADC